MNSLGWVKVTTGAAILVVAGFMVPASSSAISPLTLDAGRTVSAAREPSGHLHHLRVTEQDGHSYLWYETVDPLFTLRRQPVLIATSTLRLRRPQVVVDAQQTVHILWQERFAKGASSKMGQGTWVHYAQLGVSAASSSIIVRRHIILNERPQAFHPDLAVDTQGTPYAVWEEKDGSIILATIPVQGHEIRLDHLATHIGPDHRGYPAIAVGPQGNVHLVWTNDVGRAAKEMVHSVLRKGDLAPVAAEQPIYSTSRHIFGQPKSLRINEQSGQLLVIWQDKMERGPLRSSQSVRRLSLAPAPAARGADGSQLWEAARVTSITDQSLSERASRSTPADTVALLRKPLSFGPLPALAASSVASGSDHSGRRLHGTTAIHRLLLERLLAFSSWSGAPPPGGVHNPHVSPWNAPDFRHIFSSIHSVIIAAQSSSGDGQSFTQRPITVDLWGTSITT